MKTEDLIQDEWSFRQEYEGTCDNCKKRSYLKTQSDNEPEYYSIVYLKCDCGDWVRFRLPVN